MYQKTNFSFDDEVQMVVCDHLDVSNPEVLAELCAYLNKGFKVQANQVVKCDSTSKVPYTLTGKVNEQIGKGVVISGYKTIYDNYIVDIH